MQRLSIAAGSASGLTMSFEMQPILLSQTHTAFAYELLYRGPRPVHWPSVDMALLNYIREQRGVQPVLFINLSNETVLTENLLSYVPADRRNRTIFELTETITDADEYREIAKRVNSFTAQGMRFAIDDFGSGFDGLHRYAALDEVAFVKLDRLFLKSAVQSPVTRRILQLLTDEWNRAGTLIIAEGIEAAEELAFAKSIGVNMLQGFLIDTIHQSTLHSAVAA